MGAIRALARTQFRRRWRALVLLGVLAGVIGGSVLTTATMARRTSTAYERLTRVTKAEDMLVLALGPSIAERITALDGIASSWVPDVVVGKLVGTGSVNFLAVMAGGTPPPNLFAPIPVKGRLFDPDAADEAVVTELFAEAASVDLGDTVRMDLITVDQFEEFAEGIPDPKGPSVALRITGVIRYPSNPDSLGGLIASPAFRDSYVNEETDAGGATFVRLDGGRAAGPAFREQLEALAREIDPETHDATTLPFEVIDPAVQARAIASTAGVLVTGLAAFAIIAAIAGVFVLVQVALRHHAASIEEQGAERALGVTAGQRTLSRTLPTLLAGGIAAAIAVAAAIALSPLAPLGVIATHEPDPGVEANVALLSIGAVWVVLMVVGIEAIAAARAGRIRRTAAQAHPSWLAERIATIGGRPPLVIGLRFAFEPGRGRRAVPVRSVLAGTMIGIAGLLAVASFSDRIHDLTTEPARYGFRGDFTVVDFKDRERDRMLADDRIETITEFRSSAVRRSGGESVPTYGTTRVKGDGGWTMIHGRAPTGPLEVAIGSRLARTDGLAVGDLLELTERQGGTRSLTIVGIGMGPTLSSEPFGSNVLLTNDAIADLGLTEPTREAIVSVAAGVRVGDVTSEYRKDMELFEAAPPPEVDNLRQLGQLPRLLTILLGLFAIAAIVNGLVLGVRRRRGDLAILRTIGFDGAQLRSAIRSNGLAIAIAGVIVGLPFGVALSNAAWRFVSANAYVADETQIPVTALSIIGPAVLVIAVALAIVPGRRAARTHPATILHVE